MRTTLTAITLAGFLLLAATGCVPSIHPLYTPETLAAEPGLPGVWVSDDGSARWDFRPSGTKEYDLRYTERDVKNGAETAASFSARVVRLGKFRFLDICPVKLEPGNDLYRALFIPSHLFLRLEIEGDKLRLAILDGDWLKKELRGGRVALAHERIGDERSGREILLTASTRELQRFMLAQGGNAKAFPEPGDLMRQR